MAKLMDARRKGNIIVMKIERFALKASLFI